MVLWFCAPSVQIVPVQGKSKSDHLVYHIMLLLVDGSVLSPVRICPLGTVTLVPQFPSWSSSHHCLVGRTQGIPSKRLPSPLASLLGVPHSALRHTVNDAFPPFPTEKKFSPRRHQRAPHIQHLRPGNSSASHTPG